MVDDLEPVQNPVDRKALIQQTLNNQWRRMFPQNVANEHNNRRHLAEKIDRLLVHAPIGTSLKNTVVRYIREVQSSLKTIRQECSHLHFKQNFRLPIDAQIEAIHIILRPDKNKLVFLVKFGGGRTIACFAPDDIDASPIVDNPVKDIKSLSLQEASFQITANGNQYHRALSKLSVKEKALEEANAVDFHLDNIEINRDHLTNKILEILAEHSGSAAQKREIIEQVKQDAINYMHEAMDHLGQDLAHDENFRLAFDLKGDEQIARIEVLGEETHNRGKSPLLIVFTDGKRIVYKPRSLVAEWAICSVRESLFSHANLPTYTVVNKGEYGYVQYLQNLQDRNMFATVQEIEEYLQNFVRMDQILLSLRASDFHSENVITENRRPHLIDTEVVMGPVARPTSLATTDFYSAWVYQEHTYNRIWVTQEVAEELQVEAPNGLIPNDEFYEIFGKTMEDLKNQPSEIEGLRQRIEQVQKHLSVSRHRIVAIPTEQLVRFINIDPVLGFPNFIHQLREDLPQHNLQFIEESQGAIKHQFELDVLHNDVPIFYYDPEEGTCFYKDILIARGPVFLGHLQILGPS